MLIRPNHASKLHCEFTLITSPEAILSNAVATTFTFDVGIPLLVHSQTIYIVLPY